MSYKTGDIPYIGLTKQESKLTNRLTNKNQEVFRTSVQTSQQCLKKQTDLIQNIIDIIINVNKQAKEQTEGQWTYKKFRIIYLVYKHPRNASKNSERYIIQNQRYPYIDLISVLSTLTNRLTDLQKIKNYLDSL